MRNIPFRSIGRSAVRGRSGKFRIWPVLLFGAYILYYYSAHQEVVPVTGRKQLVDVTPKQELALGISSYREILSNEKVISAGPELENLLKVANRIAKVVHKDGFDWEFNLIDSPQANAFALPGGKVAVYSGILAITQNNDGLAAVLGHEIAHAVARHGAERMTHQKLTQIGTMAIGMSVGEMEVQTQRMVMGALGVGARFGILLPYSRKHESEADYIGLTYLAKACFDPREAPKLWERMAKANSGKNPAEFMSTHPSPATRIEQFKEWIPNALVIKNQNCSL